MLGQVYEQRPNAYPNNQNYQMNPSQRIAMSYPPSQPLQNHLHVQHKQQGNYPKEAPQVPHVPLYQNGQNRGNIPGEMPGSDIKDNVGGPYMQVYNYGTAHLVEERP